MTQKLKDLKSIHKDLTSPRWLGIPKRAGTCHTPQPKQSRRPQEGQHRGEDMKEWRGKRLQHQPGASWDKGNTKFITFQTTAYPMWGPESCKELLPTYKNLAWPESLTHSAHNMLHQMCIMLRSMFATSDVPLFASAACSWECSCAHAYGWSIQCRKDSATWLAKQQTTSLREVHPRHVRWGMFTYPARLGHHAERSNSMGCSDTIG